MVKTRKRRAPSDPSSVEYKGYVIAYERKSNGWFISRDDIFISRLYRSRDQAKQAIDHKDAKDRKRFVPFDAAVLLSFKDAEHTRARVTSVIYIDGQPEKVNCVGDGFRRALPPSVVYPLDCHNEKLLKRIDVLRNRQAAAAAEIADLENQLEAYRLPEAY
jgi:hypothetical protein